MLGIIKKQSENTNSFGSKKMIVKKEKNYKEVSRNEEEKDGDGKMVYRRSIQKLQQLTDMYFTKRELKN